MQVRTYYPTPKRQLRLKEVLRVKHLQTKLTSVVTQQTSET